MDFRGLVGGAANVARGYRDAEERFRVAEENESRLQAMRRADEERRRLAATVRAPQMPVPLGETLPAAVSPLDLPRVDRLGVRDVRPPVPPADPRAYGTWDVPGRVAEPTPGGAVTSPVSEQRVATSAPLQLAPADEALGVAFEQARATRRAAEERYFAAAGSVQRAANPTRYEAAKREYDAAVAAEKAAQQAYLSAVQPQLPAVQTQRPGLQVPPAAAQPAAAQPAAPTTTDALVKAMTQVESSGRPGAVSPRGAVGLMQVLPSTAMNPGYGLPNIFDFVGYRGTRNEEAATALLKDPQTGAAYGRAYMDAMLREFGGNLDHALAAYNMGPGAAKKWVAEGADPAKLNRETREYIPKVRAELGQAAPTTAVAAAEPTAAAAAQPAAAAAAEPTAAAVAEPARPASTGAAGDTFVPGVSQKPQTFDADVYLTNPQGIMVDQRNARDDYERARDIVVRDYQQQRANLDQAFLARRTRLKNQMEAQSESGRGVEANATLNEMIELDAKYRADLRALDSGIRPALMELDTRFRNNQLALTSIAAAAQIRYQNDPTLASQVMSYAYGQDIQFQLRNDGDFDMLLPSRTEQMRVRGTIPKEQLIDMFRSASEAAYRAAKQELADAQALEMTKREADMIKAIATAKAETAGRLQEIMLQGRLLKVQADGNGGVILYTPNGDRIGVLDPRTGVTEEAPGGGTMPAAPRVRWTITR